jgi:hypothetical protein
MISLLPKITVRIASIPAGEQAIGVALRATPMAELS